MLRHGFARDPRFADLEFAFDAGGMIRGAMNEGKSTPINIRVTGKKLRRRPTRSPRRSRRKVDRDRRRGRRPDHPAARLPRVHHRRRPGQGRRPGPDPGGRDAERRGRVQLEHPVQQEELLDRPGEPTTSTSSASQYPEEDIESVETLLDIPITSPMQKQPIPLREPGDARPDDSVPTEVTHYQHPADDRADDGRRRPRPGPRRRRRRRGRRPVRHQAARRLLDPLRPVVVAAGAAEGVEDRAQRRVRADAGHLP